MSKYQDVIGQFPLLKTYNHVTFGFEILEDVNADTIFNILEEASEKVHKSLPWLRGAVVNEGSGPGNSGTFKLISWPASATSPNHIVRIKDLSSVLPSFAEIEAANAPSALLKGESLAPFPGFPDSYEDSPLQPAPIVAIQANVIKGGLLLNFSAQHNIIDATGIIQYISLIATALRGEAIPASAIREGNRDRRHVIPLIGPDEGAVKDHNYLRRPADQIIVPQRSAMAQTFRWAYFHMQRSAISSIKARAEDRTDTGNDADVPFISSGDALSAFYWKCLVAVRLSLGQAPQTLTNYLRAIDARRAVGVSHEYLGHMVYHSSTRMAMSDVRDASLAHLAHSLRRSLNADNTAHAVRSYCTFIAGEPDRSKIMYGGLYNPAADIGSSAMPNIEFTAKFGSVLGVPKFIRRPQLAPIPGCVYFTFPEGDHVPVLVCLRDEELEALRKQPEWNEVAQFVG